LPRKYRPPAARRRKSKRQAPAYVEPLPQSGDGAVDLREEDGTNAFEEDVERKPVSVATADAPPLTRAPERPSTATKHIAKDYSYVRAEVRRIFLVGGVLILSLIVTALLRN
jgi:hypothetical protein